MAQFADRRYYNAFQQGRQDSARNKMNQLAIGQEESRIGRQNQLNQVLSKVPGTAPGQRNALVQEAMASGPEGLAASGQINQYFGNLGAQEQAQKHQQAQQIASQLAGVNDQASYDAVRADAIASNPQIEQQFPQQYDPNVVRAFYNRFREVEKVLSGGVQGSNIGKIDPGQYTPESISAFQRSGNYADLKGVADDSSFAKVDPGLYTPESVSRFQRSGNYADLTPRNQGPKASGPGQTQVDKEFAKEYVKWNASGGFADTQKQIGQLREVRQMLGSGNANLTGPVVGRTPEFMRALVNPKSLEAKQAVEEVVQRNLREVLGAQFTEKEGTRLIERAYNDNLDETENAKRVGRLIDQIETAASQKADAMAYFRDNGTLSGWQGSLPQMSDFESINYDQPESGQQATGSSAPPVEGAQLMQDGNGNKAWVLNGQVVQEVQ